MMIEDVVITNWPNYKIGMDYKCILKISYHKYINTCIVDVLVLYMNKCFFEFF